MKVICFKNKNSDCVKNVVLFNVLLNLMEFLQGLVRLGLVSVELEVGWW